MRRFAWRAVAWAAVVALLAALLRRVPLADVAVTVRAARTLPLLLALAVNLPINVALRVKRWAALLVPVERSGRDAGGFELAAALLAGQAASNLLPAKAGEAVRIFHLQRRGYAAAGLVAAQLVEKVVEAASLCLVCGSAAALGGSHRALSLPLWSAGAAGLGLVAFLSLVSRFPRASREGRGRIGQFLARLRGALGEVAAPAVWFPSLAWSCVSDIADAATLGLCLAAVGAPLEPAALLAVLLAVNVAILVPTTPGQIGVVEAAAVAALVGLGAASDRALAGAILNHAVQIVPATGIGLAVVWNGSRRGRSAA